ncbi:MAG: hypothetical protein U0V73_04025 [Acidimicrobiia bacterium]
MPTKPPSDTRLLVFTGAAVLFAGLLVAGLLLLLTRGNAKPREPSTHEFVAGSASTIARDLKEGGPYFFPDPFGHHRGVWLTLEDGRIVAIQQHVTGDTGCTIRWRGSVGSFVECRGRKISSRSVDRYRARVATSGANKGALILNLAVVEPAPARSTATATTAASTTAP